MRRARQSAGLPFFAGLVGVFVGVLFPGLSAGAQTKLETELRNLERLGSTGGALAQTAYLKELAGDMEGAARAWERVAQAEAPGHLAMLRAAACCMALGDWERADAALRTVLSGAAGQETRLQARFLAAQLEALRSGGTNTSGLVSLLADGAFVAYTARIYFTLWKLTGRESWLNALSGEFPHSPEAAAAGSGGTVRATAMWLLFPGREGQWPGETRPGALTAAPSTAAGPTPTVPVTGTVLQAGLFSREENARALLEKLRGAGFPAGSLRQDRSGGLYTLVYVVPGPDINASIRELKAAGFESFSLALR